MSRSRVALRFWAAMGVAPAAVVACRGGDARSPDPMTENLVVGSSDAAPIETIDGGAATDDDGGDGRGRSCQGTDRYAESQCIGGVQGPCPQRSDSVLLRSAFGGKRRSWLDAPRSATAYPGTCCYDWCETILITHAPDTSCTSAQELRYECIPAPAETSAPAASPHDHCPIGVVFSAIGSLPGRYEGAFDARTTAAYPNDAKCCYAVCGPPLPRPIPGRAARREDDVVMAPAIASNAWSTRFASSTHDIALADALLEHASVAAFSRLSLSLLAFGAPPDLLEDTHRAALDEIRHAEISFARAGSAIGPGPCLAFADLRAHRSLADLAEETYRDGCIGETVASLELRAVLPDVAADEERHAELAWRIVEWALHVGGDEVRIARAAAARSTPKSTLGRWAEANVIAPCTDALLSARSETA